MSMQIHFQLICTTVIAQLVLTDTYDSPSYGDNVMPEPTSDFTAEVCKCAIVW